MIRRGSALALLGLALLGAGCASAPGGAAESPAAAASAPAESAVRLEIEAPPALKTLLERHMDLARLPTLARGEAIGEFELARLIDAAPAQARDLLQTEGYFEPAVVIERTPGTGTAPQLRLSVQPGPRVAVQRFDLEVEGDLARAESAGDRLARTTLSELRRQWPLKPGAPFRNPDWADAKAATLARLRSAGYATAVWSGTAADVDVAQRQARLFLVADSGPLFRSGALEVEGLKMHGRESVANLSGFTLGTPVTETLLLDFQDRLVKSGLFERVSVTIEPDPKRADAVPIDVRVAERSRHQLTLGVGVSANAGPRATVEHVDRRVFGFAVTARNKAEWGRDRQSWDGEISTHTGPDLYRKLLGVTIERLKTDTDTVLSQRLRLGRAQEAQRIERFVFGEVLRDARRTSLARTEANATTLNAHWIWRDIDDPLLPTDGQTLSLQAAVGQARSTLEGHGAIARLYGRATIYRPLGRQWYGLARLELGQIVGAGKDAAPDTMGFRAGGDESVRGYAYRTLGPAAEGAAGSGLVLMTSSIEFARPVSPALPEVWAAVFVDAGNAADRWGDLKPALGAGVGVRWRSPVGPLKLDVAYGRETRRTRLHFSVGIVF